MSSARPNASEAREEATMTSTSLLQEAFAHHEWATIRLVDSCEDLSPQQLRHEVPGTRGPIIETLAHIIDGRDLAGVEDASLDLGAIRRMMQRNSARWSSFLAGSPDPDATVTEVDPSDGFRRDASVGMRLAAALEHGSDHRSQICTALTTLGIRPPAINVMTFGVEVGRVEETPGTS